jgi:serine/threonine protein kinase
MPAPPRHVGHYQIIREIGRGGMGRVYLARQVTLNRDVALKELSLFHATSPGAAARFLRESQLGGSLNHPNVVMVLEYFEDQETPFIAMEYVPRGSLRPYVARLKLAAFAGVMEGILAGLAHAQSFGIVHRDLKPENIMVTAEGRVKIADFGIAKATQVAAPGAFATASGVIVGTPRYMAPEQILGQEIGTWTDMYSLGVMAYEHTVGQVPFHDTDVPTAILMRHVRDEIPAPIEVNPEIDPELSRWIAQLLVKDPTRRTHDPVEAWEQLEEIVLRLLGPRWRREARLPEQAATLDPPRPLTPAPFSAARGAAASTQAIFTEQQELVEPLPTTVAEADETALLETVQSTRTTQRPDRTVDTEPSAPQVPTRRQPSRRPPRDPVPQAEATHPQAEAGHAPPRRRLAAGVAVAVVLVAAAVVGFASGHSGHDGKPAGAATRTATAGHVSLTVPATWVVPSSPPTVTGLKFTQPLARSAPGSSDSLTAGGLAGATGRLLLPPTFASRLSHAPTTNDPVRLGDVSAYRYANLSVKGMRQRVTLFVIPTSSGVVGVACLVSASASFLRSCQQAAATVHLTAIRGLPLGPSAAYDSALGKSVGIMDTAATAARGLQTARTSAAQSSLCHRLAQNESQAASILAASSPGPDAAVANARLVSYLRTASNGYATMSIAASRNDSKRYNVARSEAAGAVEGSRGAVSDLRAMGY